ncbi:hypothetical protein [Pantoea sp. FN0305]|uniref:hypothetical protein n=1 Tax=Pantoea sp. FN0305 TaxID=3418559 RepID=UPI003CF358D6
MDWGNGSDLVSAVCNIAMAGAAIYAASNAKDWLSPKLNERKFKFADELIEKFCILQQEAFYLHADVKQIINTDPEEQGDIAQFRKRWHLMYDRENTYRKNTVSLQTEMERMELWGLKPKNKAEFTKIIKAHLDLAYTISDSLGIGASESQLRLKNSFIYDKKISEKYRAVRASHNNIIKHYSKLFID